MSSLKDQLSQIAANNSTVALDRKKRQKIHSASLIYNPKTAATQDYEFIYENSIEALNELIDIDPRFEFFTRSLFSESSIVIDRNTKTKDDIKELNAAINSYLMLVSSKWHLSPALYATEWLVRRFQINVHNAEMFLFSTLNYYQQPVFKRILNIVKLPALFQPLSNFVRSDNALSKLSIIKLFSDFEFLTLYCNYIAKCVSQKVTYTSQILFAACTLINMIAVNSTEEKKLSDLLPTFMEISAKLLVSDDVDCQIAAHTILVVFASTTALSKPIILAATETILANLKNEKAKRSALITIANLLETLKGQGNIDQLPINLYKLVDAKFSLQYLKDFSSRKESRNSDKFFTSYIRSIIRYDHDKLADIVEILKHAKFEKFEIKVIITDLIHLSEIIEDKSKLIGVFEYLVGANESMVLKALKSLNLSGELFEIRLTTSLFNFKESSEVTGDQLIKDVETSKIVGMNSTIQPFKEWLQKNSDFFYTKDASILAEKDQVFNKLLSLFVESVGKKYSVGLFLNSFFSTFEARITFLLRIIVSPAAPIALRLIAVSSTSKMISSVDNETNLFSIVPILIAGLFDVCKNVRSNIKILLHQISKRAATEHYFLLNKLYGDDVKIPMLSPRDSKKWLTRFLENYVVDNTDIAKYIIQKKTEKVDMFFWCNQALYVPLPYTKLCFLNVLTQYRNYSSKYSELLCSILKSYLEERAAWELRCKNNKTDFTKFEASIVSIISSSEKNAAIIDFIISALKTQYEQLCDLVVQKLIQIYPKLKFANQLAIVNSIIETTAIEDLHYDSLAALQSLPIDAEIFVSILQQNRINGDSGEENIKKRRRKSSSSNKAALKKEEVSQIAEVHLRKITIILETLDARRTIKGTEALLSLLFDHLADLETLDQDGGLPVLYAQETLASCMLNIISSLKDSGENINSIRSDIVVSAIRSSPSPQVQNKLLLVIGALAELSPETILHSVMPIFTFMGAHTIRQDDEYSTHVVTNTIKTVVPALLKSSQYQKDSMKKTEEIEFLLTSFATAFDHVPKHRRVSLFSTLVKTLGSRDSVAPFLFLLGQQYSVFINKFKISAGKDLVEFTKNFLSKFSAIEQLSGILGFFQLIDLLPVEPTEDSKEKLLHRAVFNNGIFNFNRGELRTLKKNLFEYTNKLISENETDYYTSGGGLKFKILSVLIEAQDTNNFAGIQSIKDVFGKIIEEILYFINNCENILSSLDKNGVASSSSVNGNNDNEVDYKEAVTELKDTIYSLLTNTLELLPIQDYISAIIPLLNNNKNDLEVKYHIILSISSKFQYEPMTSSTIADEIIGVLFGNCVSEENSSPVIIQASLNVVSSLFDKFKNHLDPSKLMEGLTICSTFLSSEKVEIQISSLACLTNSIQILGVKTISFYSKIVPRVLEIFKTHKTKEETVLKYDLQLAINLLFAAIIKRIPMFVISNLYDVLNVIFFSDEVPEDIRLPIIQLVVEKIELKEVLKNLNKIWLSDISLTSNSVAISLFLSTLESTVEALDKKTAVSQSPLFFRLLLSLFEYRAISKFDVNTINRIEASVHKIANNFVLKLNDKVFRPLFALLVRWAFDGEGVINSGKITRTERLTAFFKFFNKLQDNLKSIVTTYFTYLLENTNNLLLEFIGRKNNDENERETLNLRRLVLISLTSSFKYDRDEYWKSTARFELIVEPLVDQLGNIENSIGKYLVKAIGSLASNNSGSDDHNKIMNKLLIQHMKATCKSTEKLWSVRTFKLIYSKVGESWLVLLPQLVPIIAELLEDDDEQVEYEVRTGLVKVVESILGEPFDRYLD
ncbi:probable U3 small nucleolar RNA-associated protein 10 [Saccharomycodes ludwigii]|uniref:U3 small nucleolar RNA-associated protein 10 n=1 Tax=Saccharomycodes ludwigii TaxID=36035 RepID=A0A376B5A2_9ASCO|nr:probable U3 small nucleolar RNA-associated protein 10 [Saccharomycodes ludwigii]